MDKNANWWREEAKMLGYPYMEETHPTADMAIFKLERAGRL